MLLSFPVARCLKASSARDPMNVREPDDLALYEQRILALEAKLRALESTSSTETLRQTGSISRPSRRNTALVATWAVLILLFGAFTPTMFTWPPYASMLGFNAIIVVLTLGLIIPLTRRRLRSLGREHADVGGDAGGDPQRERQCPNRRRGRPRAGGRGPDRRGQRVLRPLFPHPLADRNARRRLFR